MYQQLTPAGEQAVTDLSGRYGVSTDAVRTMLDAVNAGRGSMAQFSIPELGGSGQWMRGGMTMVGNMFDHGLKARVDGLCRDLSDVLAAHQVYPPTGNTAAGGGTWWPGDLGNPSSSGGQNGSQYAYFPGSRRLAVLAGGRLSIYDTLDHSIGGVQQQQGGGPGSLEFTSQYGTFTAASLPLVAPEAPGNPSRDQGFGQSDTAGSRPTTIDEITSAIEALASLHGKGILTDDEFFTKKAELLKRI